MQASPLAFPSFPRRPGEAGPAAARGCAALRARSASLRCALAALLLAAPGSRASDDASASDDAGALVSLLEGSRAEAAGTLERPAGGVTVLPAAGPDAWPAELREPLERRIAREWRAGVRYGVVQGGIGAQLAYPLVLGRVDGRVVVPVVEDEELAIDGTLDLLRGFVHPRRLALLIDTSASANDVAAPAASAGAVADAAGGADGPLAAGWRAVESVLDLAEREPLEVSVIAFGGTARTLVPAGVDPLEARARIAKFRRENPRGFGRTDAVCALWMGREWLEEAPRGVERHLAIVTDGAAPDSGRFPACAGAEGFAGPIGSWLCTLARNDSPCRAAHELVGAEGRSDWDQIEHFAGDLPERVRLHVLAFADGNERGRYARLVERVGGSYAEMAGEAPLERALLHGMGERARSAVARNETTGARSRELLQPDGQTLRGRLRLRRGANDVVLRVERAAGPPTVYRFRLYAEPRLRSDYLARLRERSRELEASQTRLVGQAARELRRGAGRVSRDLRIGVE